MSRDALIVGINQYQALPSLTAAAKDAEGIARTLEAYSNFRVRRLPEIITDHRPHIGQQAIVSAQQLEHRLIHLFLPKGDHVSDTVLLYFSGHGLQRDMGIREGYLATSDTQPDTLNNGLSLSWLRRLIRHSPVRQIIVILDCCHSGEFLCLKDEPWQGRDGQSYLFIAASREYEEAYEALKSDYSVLTQALLSGLQPQSAINGRVTTTDLIATITNQLSDEIQQPLFEQGGSEIVITCQSEHTVLKTDNSSVISRLKQYSLNFCPYRGAQAFEEKHSRYYFGREKLIQELLNTLQNNPICALIGASGSGKTSLLRAGIIPRLSTGNDILGSNTWLIRCINLGPQPLKALATTFTSADQEIEIASQILQAEQLLHHEPMSLVNLVTAALLQKPAATHFCLILDQFEELLWPTSDYTIQQERQQFFRVLTTALNHPSLMLKVIISLRSDTIDGLLDHSNLFSRLKTHQVLVTPMSYQEIRDVIEKPAEKLGLKIDPYLVHNLTLDLTGSPGELALLQTTLYELWKQRIPTSGHKGEPCLSLDSYLKLGRISKLLIEQATEFYESLPSNEQAAAQRIFLALCDLGEGQLDQCRQVRKQELINQQFSMDLIDTLLKKLADARLIVSNKITATQVSSQPEGRPIAAAWETRQHQTADIQRWFMTNWPPTPLEPRETGETIVLVHKSLVSDWPLLRQWLQTSRSILRQQREIEEKAWIWHYRGELNCSDYVLGQQYLADVSQFLRMHSQSLSTLAQRFVAVSRRTVTYQRWRTRGIAVLLPLAVMAGMTVSLVRHQLAISWRLVTMPTTTVPETTTPHPNRSVPALDAPLHTFLPQHRGDEGAERLVITSQILVFQRKYPHSDLSQIPIVQLANLITPDTNAIISTPLPDTSKELMNSRENE